jgi:Family of unknown function (DUF6088)
MKEVHEKSQSTEKRILARIRGYGMGAVFVPGDFLDLGSREGIDFALHRLVRRGTVRRLARGLYDYPKTHPKFGVLSPTIDAVVKALAGRDRIRIQPSGAYAANLLRLSEQVPAKAVFLTDGPSRRIKVGNTEIILKRTTPRAMAVAGRISGLLIQALKYIGKENVTVERLAAISRDLTEKDRKQLMTDLPLAPAWMRPYLKVVAKGLETA